jgi:hypothetical protein
MLKSISSSNASIGSTGDTLHPSAISFTANEKGQLVMPIHRNVLYTFQVCDNDIMEYQVAKENVIDTCKNLNGIDTVYDTVFLFKPDVFDDSITIELGLFGFDSSNIPDTVVPRLNAFIDFLNIEFNKYPLLTIELRGSADCRAHSKKTEEDKHKYNYDLSLRRAKSVFNYLYSKKDKIRNNYKSGVIYLNEIISCIGLSTDKPKLRFNKQHTELLPPCSNCDYQYQPGNCDENDHWVNRYVVAVLFYNESVKPEQPKEADAPKEPDH